MTEFKPLDIFEVPRAGAQVTDENLYWKKLGFPYAFKEFGAIDFIDVCQQEPFNVAATCSAQVQIYSTANNVVQCSLSRFKKTAYGGTFRQDGKLLAAGSEDGFLRLFELQSHKLLRISKGHTAATHRCGFTIDGVHLVSFSDDKSVALWDIPTETRIKSFEEHKDYIRAGVTSQASQDIILSGSYDHTVKLYDARTGSSVISVDHGVPVESVLMFPSGGMFISAGGTSVKVWDPRAGHLLSEVSQHHKTITCLCFASDGRRLMSGSLDRHVKIYDVTSYEVVHTLNYSSPVMSVSVAPGDKVVAVGMTDGLLSLRHQKKEPISKDVKNKNKRLHRHLHGTKVKLADGDIAVPERKKTSFRKHDKYLKKFQYSLALDCVLTDQIQENEPETTMGVILELAKRGAIQAAMGGREGDSLLQLMKFVTKYIGDNRFMRELLSVAWTIIDIYGPKLNDPETKKRFEILSNAMDDAVQYTNKMLEMEGIVNAILASTCSDNDETLLSMNGIRAHFD